MANNPCRFKDKTGRRSLSLKWPPEQRNTARTVLVPGHKHHPTMLPARPSAESAPSFGSTCRSTVRILVHQVSSVPHHWMVPSHTVKQRQERNVTRLELQIYPNLLFFWDPVTHMARASHKISRYSRMIWSSHLHLLSAEVTGMHQTPSFIPHEGLNLNAPNFTRQGTS